MTAIMLSRCRGCAVAAAREGSRASTGHADLKFPGVAESGKVIEFAQDVRSHEAKLGGAGSTATGDHDY